MKKVIVFFLTAALFMPFLFSCGSGEAAKESEELTGGFVEIEE